LEAARLFRKPHRCLAIRINRIPGDSNLRGVVNYPKLHTGAGGVNRARSTTPRDAVFLFPEAGRHLDPGLFRAESLRAVYVDWKGGGQLNYLRDLATEWWFCWQQTMQGFHATDLPRYEALGIRYVVLPPRDHLLQAPVFQNSEYAIDDLSHGRYSAIANTVPAQ
jgi:hypothetical protein